MIESAARLENCLINVGTLSVGTSFVTASNTIIRIVAEYVLLSYLLLNPILLSSTFSSSSTPFSSRRLMTTSFFKTSFFSCSYSLSRCSDLAFCACLSPLFCFSFWCTFLSCVNSIFPLVTASLCFNSIYLSCQIVTTMLPFCYILTSPVFSLLSFLVALVILRSADQAFRFI